MLFEYKNDPISQKSTNADLGTGASPCKLYNRHIVYTTISRKCQRIRSFSAQSPNLDGSFWDSCPRRGKPTRSENGWVRKSFFFRFLFGGLLGHGCPVEAAVAAGQSYQLLLNFLSQDPCLHSPAPVHIHGGGLADG